MSIGTNIKKIRKFYNISATDLAGILGVSKSAVSIWENNKGDPRYDMIIKIAFALGVSPSILVADNLPDDIELFKRLNDSAMLEDNLDYVEHLLVTDPNFSEMVVVYGNLTNEGRLSAYNHLMELEKIPEYQWNNQKKEKD